MGSSSSPPSPPPPTSQELELLKAQTDLLNQQRDILNQDRETILENRELLKGISGLFDEEGNVNEDAISDIRTQMDTDISNRQRLGEIGQGVLEGTFQQSEFDQLSQQIGQAEGQRLLQALEGQGPSATLKEQERKDFEQLKESAGRRGIRLEGKDLFGATSQGTAGNQLIADLRRNAEARRDSERNAIISQATGANLNRLGLGLTGRELDFNQAQSLQASGASPYAQQLGFGLNALSPSGSGQFGQLAGQFGQATQPFTQQRMLEYQSGIQNSANQAASNQGLGSLLGGAAGAGLGYTLYAANPALGAAVGLGLGGGFGGSLGNLF